LPRAARSALDYPARPVHVIVGQAAGSSSDITARLIAQFLFRLGQQFIVEIRPGATGNIAPRRSCTRRPTATRFCWSIRRIRSTRRSSTIFRSISSATSRRSRASYRVALVMEVLPSFPAKTVPEFIAYAKANPGKINMASAGVGGPQHVAGELFKFMAGVDLVHVPYHGTTPALTDLLGGQVQVMFDVTPTSLPHIRAGKLRALAVTTPERLDVLPGRAGDGGVPAGL
jgi:tripartite-type tricarboxylate transporter receptor subunit TctC